MNHAKRKKELLESLVKEKEAGVKELLSGDSIISMEDQQQEDEADKLIKEVLELKKS